MNAKQCALGAEKARSCFGAYRLAVVFALFLAANKINAVDLNYKPSPVKISGCPAELKIYLPAEFVKPTTVEEKNIHQKILSDLHSNKNRKTTYSNIFLTSWTAPNAYPQVAIGSLGTLSSIQGNVTQKNWSELKNYFLSKKASQMHEFATTDAKKLLEDISDIDLNDTQVSKPYEIDNNSIAMIGSVSANVNGEPVNIYSSMKMVYVKKCIVYMNISVGKEEKYSREYFLSLIRNVTVN